MRHSYPQDLVDYLFQHWAESIHPRERGHGGHSSHGSHAEQPDPLPDPAVVEQLISTCYQSSMLHEEERPVRFRLIFREPDRFPPEQGPPTGLHRLVFKKPRPFTEYELQKLAPAVDFYRSLIGVRLDPEAGLQIWGVAHSGPRWIQAIQGGSKQFTPLPPALVLYTTRSGRISVCRGSTMLGMLAGGRVITPSLNIFDTSWLQDTFGLAREELWALHHEARALAEGPWAALEPDLVEKISQQVVKRILSIIRNSRHGGALVFLPPERVDRCVAENGILGIKYSFEEEEPRQRFRTLLLELLNTLAAAYGDPKHPDRVVGWKEYVGSKNAALSRLDEAIFEYAHLIAGLTAVDGAVILTSNFELIGFGAVILGALDKLEQVAYALDAEGTVTEQEPTDGSGTRHRAAYHLCHTLHDALAIVVSQDGNVRVAKWKNDMVTCWEVIPITFTGLQ